MASVQRIDIKDGQNGKFARLLIDGKWYTAFPPLAQKAFTLNVGDEVVFTSKQKGDFYNLTGLEKASPGGSNTPAPTPSPTAPPATKPYGKNPEEFNYMMAVSYAKDLLIADKAKSVSDAVALVFDLYSTVKSRASTPPTVSQSPRPVEPTQTEAEELQTWKTIVETYLNKKNVDPKAHPYREYVKFRFNHYPEKMTLEDYCRLAQDLEREDKGELYWDLTTDNILMLRSKSLRATVNG